MLATILGNDTWQLDPPPRHIAVALLKAGQRVATINLDTWQESFTPPYREPSRLVQADGHRPWTAASLLRRFGDRLAAPAEGSYRCAGTPAAAGAHRTGRQTTAAREARLIV